MCPRELRDYYGCSAVDLTDTDVMTWWEDRQAARERINEEMTLGDR